MYIDFTYITASNTATDEKSSFTNGFNTI